MKKLKVWGGMYIGKETKNKQVRAIVAAYTKKQVCEISGMPINFLNGFWCETGNEKELSVAIEVGMWLVDQDKNCTRIK